MCLIQPKLGLSFSATLPNWNCKVLEVLTSRLHWMRSDLYTQNNGTNRLLFLFFTTSFLSVLANALQIHSPLVFAFSVKMWTYTQTYPVYSRGAANASEAAFYNSYSTSCINKTLAVAILPDTILSDVRGGRYTALLALSSLFKFSELASIATSMAQVDQHQVRLFLSRIWKGLRSGLSAQFTSNKMHHQLTLSCITILLHLQDFIYKTFYNLIPTRPKQNKNTKRFLFKWLLLLVECGAMDNLHIIFSIVSSFACNQSTINNTYWLQLHSFLSSPITLHPWNKSNIMNAQRINITSLPFLFERRYAVVLY